MPSQRYDQRAGQQKRGDNDTDSFPSYETANHRTEEQAQIERVVPILRR